MGTERIPQGVAVRFAFQAYLAGTANPAEGKTIVVKIWKASGAYVNPHAGATNATEVSDGTYYVDLDSTDVGTPGPLEVLGTEGTIDNVYGHLRVVDPHTLGASALPGVASGAAGSVATTTDGAAIPPRPSVGDANVVQLNGTTLHGNGSSGNKWGP